MTRVNELLVHDHECTNTHAVLSHVQPEDKMPLPAGCQWR